MKAKPSWALWFLWLSAYTALDMVIGRIWHGTVSWKDLPDAARDALFGATVTWLFALYRWYKAENS